MTTNVSHNKDPNAWYGATDCAAANVSRGDALVNGPALVSGRLELTAIYIPGGTPVQFIRFLSGSTGAGTPTHQMAGIYGTGDVLLAGSSDITTTVWNSTDYQNFAITPWTCPESGLYHIGIFVVASVMPTLLGTTLFHLEQGSDPPYMCGTAETGLTTALPNPVVNFSPTTAFRAAWLRYPT